MKNFKNKQKGSEKDGNPYKTFGDESNNGKQTFKKGKNFSKNYKNINRNKSIDNDFSSNNSFNKLTIDRASKQVLNLLSFNSLNIKINEIFKSGYNSGQIYDIPKDRITKKTLLKAKPSKFGGRIQSELIQPTSDGLALRISYIKIIKRLTLSGHIYNNLSTGEVQATLFNKGLITAYKKLHRDTLSNVFIDVPLLNMTMTVPEGSELEAYMNDNGLTNEQLVFMLLLETYKSNLLALVRQIHHVLKFRRYIPALKRKFPYLNEVLDKFESELSRSKFTTVVWQIVKLINQNYFDDAEYNKFISLYDLVSSKTDAANSPVIHIDSSIIAVNQDLHLNDDKYSGLEITDTRDGNIKYTTQSDLLKAIGKYISADTNFSFDKALVTTLSAYNTSSLSVIETYINTVIDNFNNYIQDFEKDFNPVLSYLASFNQTKVWFNWKQNSFKILVMNDESTLTDVFNRKVYFSQMSTMPRVSDIEDELKTLNLEQQKVEEDTGSRSDVVNPISNSLIDGVFSKLTPINQDDGIPVNDITEGFKYSEIYIISPTVDQVKSLPGIYNPDSVSFYLQDGSQPNRVEINGGDTDWNIPPYFNEFASYVQTFKMYIRSTDGLINSDAYLTISPGNIVMWERVTMSEYTDLVYSDGVYGVPFLFSQATLKSDIKNKF